MEPWIQMIITITCSVIASSGFWAYLQKKLERKDVKTEMLIGLGHDRIIYLGLYYIERGWITQDEYENLNDYLYKPYAKMGANGSAKRVMQEVDKLPIRKTNPNIEPNSRRMETFQLQYEQEYLDACRRINDQLERDIRDLTHGNCLSSTPYAGDSKTCYFDK